MQSSKNSLFPFSFLLFPFSYIYGIGATLRRKAFQKGWLTSETLAIPTICVGNLRVGGTGKTPMVAYIANFLSQNHEVAILSRGYGRKTKGYINAQETENLNCRIMGDEPMQYATKFPNVEVAVCEKRKNGIENLVRTNPKLEVVILDDAYQHLSVNYSLRIVLTEYHRPFFKDFPLPSGALRERCNAAKYADIIIVTKCPDHLTAEEKADFSQKLKLQPNQNLFFTKIRYVENSMRNEVRAEQILLITGIANPSPLVQHLETLYKSIYSIHFPDHHFFTKKDIEKIIHLKEKLGGDSCTIITTEKDAVRLQAFENMPEYHTIPIEIVFLENETVFKEKLLSLLKS